MPIPNDYSSHVEILSELLYEFLGLFTSHPGHNSTFDGCDDGMEVGDEVEELLNRTEVVLVQDESGEFEEGGF